MKKNALALSRAGVVFAIATSLAACGGGGSSAPTNPTLSAGTTLSQASTTRSTASLVAASGLTAENERNCREHHEHCIARVLLISIDGMHAVDLQRYVASHPESALGRLSHAGITYANAHAPVPTDSFPGLLALTTGGHPASTGVYYEVNYDRTLFPPKSNCTGTPGTVVAFDESIDFDSTKIDGGGGINPANLTLAQVNGACKPVYPHDYLRVNTIFEAVKAHGGRTAWSDKEQSYDILNGPSGNGVDDLYNREIAAGGTTGSIDATEAYDDTKVAAILNQIDGKTARGVAGVGVPTLFGMNFQAVSVGQKLATANFGVGPRGGYLDANAAPTPLLEQAIAHTDASIGKFLTELANRGLAKSTLVIISAKHGQAPININLRRGIAGAAGSFGSQLATNGVGFVQTDDLALIWLTDRSAPNLLDAKHKLQNAAFQTALGYERGDLFSTSEVPPGWGKPNDPRIPDFAVQVDLGVIYTGGTKIAEHGGFSDEDSHVALLVSPAISQDDDGRFAQWSHSGRVATDRVQTAQVAPSILKALGIDGHQLRAVQLEGTQYLPEFAY